MKIRLFLLLIVYGAQTSMLFSQSNEDSTDAPIERGALGLVFGINTGSGIIPNIQKFANYSVGGRYQLSPKSFIRCGVSAEYNNRNSTRTQRDISSDSIFSSSEQKDIQGSTTIGCEYGFVLKQRESVYLYSAIGPMFSYGSLSESDHLFSPYRSYAVGITTVIGVEVLIRNVILLAAEYGGTVNYRWDSSEYVGSGYRSSTKSSLWEVRENGTRLLLSIIL